MDGGDGVRQLLLHQTAHHQHLVAHVLELGIELTGDVFIEVHIVHTNNPCCSDYALAVEPTGNLFIDAHLVHTNNPCCTNHALAVEPTANLFLVVHVSHPHLLAVTTGDVIFGLLLAGVVKMVLVFEYSISSPMYMKAV